MAYITTPDLGLQLADPSTIQAFETTNVNSNFLLLEAGIKADRVRLTAAESAATTLSGLYNAGVGRGNLAREVSASPATLTAIADALVGDMVRITAPGTGIDPFWAECWAGPGANTADWRPQDTIIAATKANLDTFIAAWIADADLTFKVGQLAFISGTRTFVRFTSTAGAYNYLDGLVPIVPTSVAGSGVTVGPNGVVTFSAATTVSLNGCFTTEFDNYLVQLTITTRSVTVDGYARLRVAGTDQSTASTYATQRIFSTGGGAISGNADTSADKMIIDAGATSGGRAVMNLTFFGPALAASTMTIVDGTIGVAASGIYINRSGSIHVPATVCDGVTFYPQSGNWTGTLRVLAYNNN